MVLFLSRSTKGEIRFFFINDQSFVQPRYDKNVLVLDYVYKGRMYIKANQLQHVLSVIEVLSLECGVSVTKKVRKEPKDPWVEGGVFTSFTDKGVLQVRRYMFSNEFP